MLINSVLWTFSSEHIDKGFVPTWNNDIVNVLNELIEYEEQFFRFDFQKAAAFSKKESLSDFVYSGARLMVLTDGIKNKVIGTVIIRPIPFAELTVGVLGFLNITEKYRHKGYGTYLLKEAEKSLKSLGCSVVQLNIIKHNHPAKAFYAKHGYVSTQIQLAKTI